MHSENRFSHNWLIKKKLNDKVRQHLEKLNGLVVDFGCGVRPYEEDILAYADSYIGIDWGHTLHEIRADIIADLNNKLPIKSNVADCVVSHEVLEHIAEPSVMLTEAHRVLKPGGLLVISVPFQWWVHEAPWDYYRYTDYGLKYLLRKAGFHNVKVEPISGFWVMLVLKLNYQSVRLVRGPRLLRIIIRCALMPVWWSGQKIAPLMDKYWLEDKETTGYFVTANR